MRIGQKKGARRLGYVGMRRVSHWTIAIRLAARVGNIFRRSHGRTKGIMFAAVKK
jgi:hypothetical protein